MPRTLKWNREKRAKRGSKGPNISPKEQAFISSYLAEEAQVFTITEDYITNYKEYHSGREKWGTSDVPFSLHGRHRHGSDPYCKLCDEDLATDEDVFIFFVGSYKTPYHIDCFEGTKKPRQLNILYQDRAARKRGRTARNECIFTGPEPEPEWWEKAEKELRKSGYKGKIG